MIQHVVENLWRLPSLAWLGFAACAAMLLGAFGPWGKTVGLVNVSISGTDGGNDGWIVVVAALVGAGGLFWYTRGTRLAALAPLLAGVAAVATAFYDRVNLRDAANENTSSLVDLQVGWGLNLALWASLVLAVVGLVALAGNQDSPGMKVDTAKKAASGPAAPPATTEKPATSEERGKPDARVDTTTGQSSTPSAELERLAELHARGVLTDEEFQQAKQNVLRPSS